MKARTIGILDAEFTTDFDKATGGPAATIDNTISVILNERVTSENQKEFDMERKYHGLLLYKTKVLLLTLMEQVANIVLA